MCLIIFLNGFPSISLNVSSSSSSINLQVLLGGLGRCLPIRFIPLFWTCNLAPSELRKWESLPARQKRKSCRLRRAIGSSCFAHLRLRTSFDEFGENFRIVLAVGKKSMQNVKLTSQVSKYLKFNYDKQFFQKTTASKT